MRALMLLPFLTSCAPYVGYTHLSDPSIENDGYDLVCGGAKIRKTLEMSIGVCDNVRGSEVMWKFDVEYVWEKK